MKFAKPLQKNYLEFTTKKLMSSEDYRLKKKGQRFNV